MVWLLIVLVALAIAGGYVLSLRINPWRPCPHCHGRGRFNDPVWRYATRTCSRCGGQNRLPRPGIRLVDHARYERMMPPKDANLKTDRRN